MDLPQFSPTKGHFLSKEHLTKNGNKTQNTKYPAIKTQNRCVVFTKERAFWRWIIIALGFTIVLLGPAACLPEKLSEPGEFGSCTSIEFCCVSAWSLLKWFPGPWVWLGATLFCKKIRWKVFSICFINCIFFQPQFADDPIWRSHISFKLGGPTHQLDIGFSIISFSSDDLSWVLGGSRRLEVENQLCNKGPGLFRLYRGI